MSLDRLHSYPKIWNQPGVRRLSKEYIAGLFDGEGCCTIARTCRSNGRVEYDARVSVAQKDPEVLYMLQAIYGGSVKINKRNLCHQWALSGRARVQGFIDDVYPHCVVKRHALQILEEFFEPARQPNHIRLAPHVVEQRTRLRAALSDVNRAS